jgi:hypothetical protein
MRFSQRWLWGVLSSGYNAVLSVVSSVDFQRNTQRCNPDNLKLLLDLDKETPWNRVNQLLRNLPIFYGTRRSITVFTEPGHCSVFWARWIQYIQPHPFPLHNTVLHGFTAEVYTSIQACFTPRCSFRKSARDNWHNRDLYKHTSMLHSQMQFPKISARQLA